MYLGPLGLFIVPLNSSEHTILGTLHHAISCKEGEQGLFNAVYSLKSLTLTIKATSSQLSSSVAETFDLGGVRYSVQVATTSELSDVDQESIWDIFEHNMRHLYSRSSMGWDPPSKKGELFHRDSRFVLLRAPRQTQDNLEPVSEEQPIVAYSMFRFETEDDECALYCYELQVSQSVQRGGIGKSLMECLYNIARGWSMKKVMLTVFKENQAAFLFYQAMGFKVESNEEWADEDEGVDYWIMSRDVVV